MITLVLKMPSNRKSKQPAGGDSPLKKGSPDPLVKAWIERIQANGKTIQDIADFVGCTQPTVSAWKNRKVQISDKDAAALSQIDPGEAGETEHAKARRWLNQCGHTPTDIEINALIKRCSLGKRLKDSVEQARLVGDEKGIPHTDFLLAVSCFLGQEFFGPQLLNWQSMSRGGGTTGIIWRWGEAAERHLKHKALIDAVTGCLEPAPEGRLFWNGTDSHLEVRFFIQLQNEAQKKSVKACISDFRKNFAAVLQDRIKVHVTFGKWPHAADCWVHACKEKLLGVLVSQKGHLMAKCEQSQDKEIKSNPYRWSAQMIQLDDAKLIAEECLAYRDIIRDEDQLNGGKKWELLN